MDTRDSEPGPGADADGLFVAEDLQTVTDLVRRHGTLYLRYSEGPGADQRSGNSRDYEADLPLPGLSVTTISPEPWWDRPLEDWVARRLCKYDELGDEHGRYPWLLTGKVVGRGPDHEPLLTHVTPVARIAPAAVDEAARCYRARFDVGSDSRS